jgi:hypothetical protein
MQPGKPNPFPDRTYHEDGEDRPRKIGLVAEKQSGRLVRFGGCTVEDLTFLALQLPGAYQQLMASEASRRHMEWADLIAQIIRHICGLAALVILAAVSWHAIDRGASTQGASIICTGAVSIVALFVTGRTTSPKYGESPLSEPGGDNQASRDRR